jgi:hypothetical protein
MTKFDNDNTKYFECKEGKIMTIVTRSPVNATFTIKDVALLLPHGFKVDYNRANEFEIWRPYKEEAAVTITVPLK